MMSCLQGSKYRVIIYSGFIVFFLMSVLFFSGCTDAITVESYGAVGDGVTDDAEAIQRAIEFAGSSGATVLFGSGKIYALGTGISIEHDDIVLSGYGATLVVMDNATPDAVIPLPVAIFSWSDQQPSGRRHLHKGCAVDLERGNRRKATNLVGLSGEGWNKTGPESIPPGDGPIFPLSSGSNAVLYH